MTEACRYGGKGYVPKENKGEKKQSAWVEIVQSVLEENKNLSGPLRDLLERVSKQPNTPRKQAKFFNFVKSMNFRTNPKDIERAWELLSVKLELIKGKPQNGNGRVQNGSENNIKDSQVSNEKESSEIENGVNGKDTIPEPNVELTNGNAKKKNKITTNVDVESNSNENNFENNVLTKKERKEKKKREKYEAQLKEINNENSEVSNPDKEEKKAKKRKLKEESVEAVEHNKEESPELIEKNTNKDEPLAKKAKNEDAESFDWIGAISSVLSSKKKEISIKKLEKKVLAEFCATTDITDITERINKKFAKSLKKVKNVKIENEKVFLV